MQSIRYVIGMYINTCNSYNSVLFETQGHFITEFALVDPSFFTQNVVLPDQGLTAQLWQNHLLDGQYLDTSLWENLTSEERISRYSASAILDAGDGFGVPTLEYRSAHGLNASPSSSWREYSVFPSDLTHDIHGDAITYECTSVTDVESRLHHSD